LSIGAYFSISLGVSIARKYRQQFYIYSFEALIIDLPPEILLKATSMKFSTAPFSHEQKRERASKQTNYRIEI
jgi:hypothetical protein